MKLPLIAAHRGAACGNIPCNTWVAYEAALTQGADIIELDVSRSLDGELFVFHPGEEPNHLRSERFIKDMMAEEVRKLRYVNMDNKPTQFGISTLDEILERLKNRCIINIDKFPFYMEDIARTVRRHNMVDQVLVKTNATNELFEAVEQIAPDLPYMIFVRDMDDVSEMLKERKLNYRGTEVLFESENCPVAQHEYMERMHKLGLDVWVNSIVYDHQVQLAAGHNDDISVAGHPDEGWGWLIDRGFDMIQTDWAGMLRQYMNTKYQSK